MNQVREVRADRASLPVNRVTLGAGGLFAEKLFAAAGPASAGQFGRTDGRGRLDRLAAGVGPRDEDSPQWQWALPVVFVGGPVDRKRQRPLFLLHSHFQRNDALWPRLECESDTASGFALEHGPAAEHRLALEQTGVIRGQIVEFEDSEHSWRSERYGDDFRRPLKVDLRARLHGGPQHVGQVELGAQHELPGHLDGFPKGVVRSAARRQLTGDLQINVR